MWKLRDSWSRDKVKKGMSVFVPTFLVVGVLAAVIVLEQVVQKLADVLEENLVASVAPQSDHTFFRPGKSRRNIRKWDFLRVPRVCPVMWLNSLRMTNEIKITNPKTRMRSSWDATKCWSHISFLQNFSTTNYVCSSWTRTHTFCHSLSLALVKKPNSLETFVAFSHLHSSLTHFANLSVWHTFQTRINCGQIVDFFVEASTTLGTHMDINRFSLLFSWLFAVINCGTWVIPRRVRFREERSSGHDPSMASFQPNVIQLTETSSYWLPSPVKAEQAESSGWYGARWKFSASSQHCWVITNIIVHVSEWRARETRYFFRRWCSSKKKFFFLLLASFNWVPWYYDGVWRKRVLFTAKTLHSPLPSSFLQKNSFIISFWRENETWKRLGRVEIRSLWNSSLYSFFPPDSHFSAGAEGLRFHGNNGSTVVAPRFQRKGNQCNEHPNMPIIQAYYLL